MPARRRLKRVEFATKSAERATLRVVAVLAITLGACSGSDDDGIDEQPVIDVGETGIGTCLRFDDTVGAEVTELPTVGCGEPHTHEIYAVFESAEAVYPGFEALEDVALTQCLDAFDDYVGISPFESSLVYSWLVPTLNSWNQEDDRESICVVSTSNGAPLDRPVRDSGL